MTEEDPDLLAGENLDRLRGREPYSAMSERFRLTEELENAKYQNNLLVQKCRELEKERDEARRMYLASTCSDDEIIPEMKRHGWNCFKENTDYLQDLG